jgi:excisionase family DNA binding protein
MMTAMKTSAGPLLEPRKRVATPSTIVEPRVEVELLTVADTAAMLRCSAWLVRDYIARGRLRSVRLGRAVRVRRSEVERLLAELEASR